MPAAGRSRREDKGAGCRCTYDRPMPAGFVFDALKMHLKARGMTYADVARALKVSEPTVKRIFAGRNCTLKRSIRADVAR